MTHTSGSSMPKTINSAQCLQFLSELGRRLVETTGDVRASSFYSNGFPLWCNVSIRFCCMMVSLMTIGQSMVHFQTSFVVFFCNFWATRGFPLVKNNNTNDIFIVFELQINRRVSVTPHLTFLVVIQLLVSRIERHNRLGWPVFQVY